MRLAFITSLLQTGKADTGFEIANGFILDQLRALGHEVIEFGFLRNTETRDPHPQAVVLDRIVIENAVASPALKAKWLMRSIASGLPVIAAKLSLYPAENLRQKLKEHGPFDACIFNSAPVAAAYRALMDECPAILITHNVEHVSAAGNAADLSGLNAALYRREARLLHKIEHDVLRAARFVWCLSEEDRTGFDISLDGRSAVVPLLTPTETPQKPVEAGFDVGLIGTWTWHPNLVGLKWFLEKVVPILPADIDVRIAGRAPDHLKPPHRNVQILGRVDDASLFVAEARVIALTARSGTGIQLKTIETLQLGKTCVATLSSVRGIGDLPPNCLVADEAAAFASALTKAVGDTRSERSSPIDSRRFSALRLGAAHQALTMGLEVVTR
jgi:Glycosyl transferases group 1